MSAFQTCNLQQTDIKDGIKEKQAESSRSSYVTHLEMQLYLERFARSNGLDKYIKYDTSVIDVRKIDGRWIVKTKKKDKTETETEEFDYVAVCNGHYNVPFTPGDDQVPGISAFEGVAIHSYKYDGPDTAALHLDLDINVNVDVDSDSDEEEKGKGKREKAVGSVFHEELSELNGLNGLNGVKNTNTITKSEESEESEESEKSEKSNELEPESPAETEIETVVGGKRERTPSMKGADVPPSLSRLKLLHEHEQEQKQNKGTGIGPGTGYGQGQEQEQKQNNYMFHGRRVLVIGSRSSGKKSSFIEMSYRGG